MAASVALRTPEEAAALGELAAMHRCRHRWLALFCRVCVNVRATLILHAVWHNRPFDAHDLGWLAYFVVHALGGLGLCEWSLRGLREREAMERQWKMQDVRRRAQRRAWRQEGDEEGPLRAG